MATAVAVDEDATSRLETKRRPWRSIGTERPTRLVDRGATDGRRGD
ncbi:hypothetical protein GWG54_16225 [Natronococcus sp. JC468]|nr:hypothetical protein [Natronococcus sp. JC468]NKE37334.1 hypothetical protein [Natronococcus sp. JC468]